MIRNSEMRAHYWPHIADVGGEAWNACFPGDAENHAYYSACEQSGPTSHRTGAVSVSRDGDLIAAAPVFAMTFRFDASFQSGDGPLSRMQRRVARYFGVPLIGIGSPFAERCHVGLHPSLDSRDRKAALAALIGAVEESARVERIRLVALKDVVGADCPEIADVLSDLGYARVAGLPVAVLDLTGVSGIESYLQRLSPSTRKDIRRKLRDFASLRVEDRYDIEDLGRELANLYDETRRSSQLDYGEFEELPPKYFNSVAQALGKRALFRLYWVGSTLVAFNLLLIERDRIIDKFLGMRYPLAREHNLYVLSWIENVRLCIARGVTTLQTGQTAYREKLRMGSHLEPTSIWFRHRAAFTQRVLRAVAPFASFERKDPDLRAVACRSSR